MSQIKEILAAKDNELEDMQRKEVKVGDEYSFMLTRLGGKYYATSGNCTHYGAPLVGAALASDGRVMCKWHGACFNVKTGDVEDAPALDSLQTYEVKIRDGNVYVLVDDEKLSSSRRHPPCARRSPQSSETVVIVGGGASGAAAAQKLREEGFQGRIRVVSREAYYPVDRIKITKQYGIESPDAITLRPKDFWDDLDIEFQLDTDATSVDAQARKVKLSNGDEWQYDHLILASGGWPKTMGCPGENLQNIFTIRMVGNNTKISQTLNTMKEQKGRQPRVVIVGSSFIGTEIASAITQNKAAAVTIVSVDKLPLQKVLGDEIGKVLMRMHESKGVKFITEAQVLGFEHDANDLTAVGSVTIKDRDPVPADLVIIAVGVRPQTDYLQDNSDLALADDGSLVVDRYFRVVGSDNVYATGDIATFPYQHTGEQLRVEHWGFAENTGRLVAMNIAKGSLARPFSHVPYFWTAQFGTTLRYAGFAKSFDDVLIQGNTSDLENLYFVGYFSKNDEVLAICSYMKDPYVSYCAELLRLGKMPKASEISNGLDPMSIPLIVPEEEELQARM